MKFFFHDIQVHKKTFLLVYGIGIGKLNSATKQAISFPGGHPNLDDIKVQLLPLSETKASIWRQYKKYKKKLYCLRNEERHLQKATLEREFMKRKITACKDLLQNSGIDLFSERPTSSFHGIVHHSYDHAQQS